MAGIRILFFHDGIATVIRVEVNARNERQIVRRTIQRTFTVRKIICIAFLIGIIACSKKEEAENTSMSMNSDYQEQHRLQFHFSPKEKWMNDPNGLVYHNGEYHMFYQHYPDSSVWGPMHWGHAVSKDLIHWEHLPIALYPDSLGYIFSGSAVVDHENTSGLGKADQPAMVAIFTYHNMAAEKAGSDTYQTQGIAYSLDNGRTWEKYIDNPVLANPGIKDFRDPNVFWSDTYNKWIMALAVKDQINFYSSPNLKNWELESEFGKELGAHGGVWECPDLFLLEDKWILLVSINPGGPNGGSATQYFIGDFDGKTFTPQGNETRWLDYGRDNYAGVTWHNIPKADGRKIFLGWLSNWDYANFVPTDVWRSAMTLPRTLELAKDDNGYILLSKVIKEVDTLYREKREISATKEKSISLNPEGWTLYDLNLELTGEDLSSQSFEIELYNEVGDTLKLGYNGKQQFYINRDKASKNNFVSNFNGIQSAPLSLTGTKATLRLLVDVGSVEVFVNDGHLVMTSLIFPQQPLNSAKFKNTSSGSITLNGKITELKSIWNNPN